MLVLVGVGASKRMNALEKVIFFWLVVFGILKNPADATASGDATGIY